jgi:Lon protease-like protein
MPPERLPLFELPLVLLPTEILPLHIFEERYKRLFGHCRRTGSPLVIRRRADSGASAIGCLAELTEVLEEFEDGRLNVIIAGEHPVRILGREQGEDFPTASVERLTEPPAAEADLEAALACLRRLLEVVGSEDPPPAGLDSAFAIAARVELPVDVKQALLESDSETSRLELVGRTLDDLSEAAIRSRKLGELASSNGHARSEPRGA